MPRGRVRNGNGKGTNWLQEDRLPFLGWRLVSNWGTRQANPLLSPAPLPHATPATRTTPPPEVYKSRFSRWAEDLFLTITCPPSSLPLSAPLHPLLFASPPLLHDSALFTACDDYDPSRLVHISALDQHFHRIPSLAALALLSALHRPVDLQIFSQHHVQEHHSRCSPRRLVGRCPLEHVLSHPSQGPGFRVHQFKSERLWIRWHRHPTREQLPARPKGPCQVSVSFCLRSKE
jgi:hypothetical protein